MTGRDTAELPVYRPAVADERPAPAPDPGIQTMCEAIEELDRVLTPWQRRLLEMLQDPGAGRVTLQPPPRSPRILTRLCVEWFARMHDGHAHVASVDGYWCVTVQAVGYVWVRFPAPVSGGRFLACDGEDARNDRRWDASHGLRPLHPRVLHPRTSWRNRQ